MPYLRCPNCDQEMEISGDLTSLKWNCHHCDISEVGLEKFVAFEGEEVCNICGKSFEKSFWKRTKFKLKNPLERKGYIFFCKECWDKLPKEAKNFSGIGKVVEAQLRMWIEDDKPIWASCFNLEAGEQIEKYCQARYGWLVWRGNHYEERTTDGILILTSARVVYVSRTGVFKKSYLWDHSIGYEGILGLSTGGWLRKHLVIQARFKRKRKVDTLKYYIQPPDLIPEYESAIREKWQEPIQLHKTPEKKKCSTCGKPVSPDFNLCPYCGAQLRK